MSLMILIDLQGVDPSSHISLASSTHPDVAEWVHLVRRRKMNLRKWIKRIMRGFTWWVNLTVRNVCWYKIYICCRLNFLQHKKKFPFQVDRVRYCWEICFCCPSPTLVSFFLNHKAGGVIGIVDHQKIISPDSCQLFRDCHINLKKKQFG